MISRRAVLVAAAATLGTAGCGSRRSTPPPAASPATIRGEVGESIDEYLSRTVPAGAGLTAIAARGGEIAYGRGFGMADREARVPAGLDTVYDIGSITKQFTASAILTLETAGELTTSDPVARFVSVSGAHRAMTLHHLLTHTSGLVEQLGDDYAPTSREELLAAMAGSELLWAPGTGYRYSNLGYSVLAAIVETVTGAGYETYLAEHLFGPAGMTGTGYLIPPWDPAQVAVEYDQDGTPQGRPFDQPWDVDGPYWNLRGNGGILSTARDMFRWHLALQRTDILSTAAKTALFTPHVLEDNGETHYGYGWVVLSDGDRALVWHNGGNGRSYAEFLRSVDDGLMVFWVTNTAHRDGSWDLEDQDLSTEMYGLLRDG
jgi:CubicO group peptidase (beta-lactamase class C family)